MLSMLHDPQIAFSIAAFVVSTIALAFVVGEMFVVPAWKKFTQAGKGRAQAHQK
jgi:hypothetical protein